MKKPEGYEKYLGEFGECLFDSESGECVGWGFEVVEKMEEDDFAEMRKKLHLECRYPTWFVVVKVLGRKEAIEVYGAAAEDVRGPRGGWKSTMFGEKVFTSKYVSPEWQERVDVINVGGEG